jgi:hypothetical protein
MSFPININIPNAPNDPADDQPIMKQNYANIAGFLAIDHVAAGSVGNGFHQQITYFKENIPGGPPTDPTSIGFTANSTLLSQTIGPSTTIAQGFYQNQNGIFPQSAVRAFGTFISTNSFPGTFLPTNSFNVVNIVGQFGAGVEKYTINLVAGSTNVVSSNAVVLITLSNNINLSGAATLTNYTLVGNVLTITSLTPPAPIIYNFAILQI